MQCWKRMYVGGVGIDRTWALESWDILIPWPDRRTVIVIRLLYDQMLSRLPCTGIISIFIIYSPNVKVHTLLQNRKVRTFALLVSNRSELSYPVLNPYLKNCNTSTSPHRFQRRYRRQSDVSYTKPASLHAGHDLYRLIEEARNKRWLVKRSWLQSGNYDAEIAVTHQATRGTHFTHRSSTSRIVSI